MKQLENKNILVAGGAGFIGSMIVRVLLYNGANVVVIDNFTHGRATYVQNLKGYVQVYECDINNKEWLAWIVSKNQIDYVINCVGDTYVPAAYINPKRFFDSNTYGVLNLLTIVKDYGIKRMIHLSSTEVYGITDQLKIDEHTMLNPENTYAVSKLAGDQLCKTMHFEHGVPVVVARLFNAYGPRETHPYIIPEIITQFHRNAHQVFLGNIRAERDFTYVRDTAKAILKLLFSSIPDGDVVNVGSNNSYSVEELVHIIAKLMGRTEYEIIQDSGRLRARDIDKFRCDNSKLKKYTSWEPEIELKEGLAETIEWFKNNNHLWSWEERNFDYVKTPQNIGSVLAETH